MGTEVVGERGLVDIGGMGFFFVLKTKMPVLQNMFRLLKVIEMSLSESKDRLLLKIKSRQWIARKLTCQSS